MRKYNILTVFVLLFSALLCFSAGSYAQETKKIDLGIGLGVPYGGAGLNLDVPAGNNFALTAGVGYVPLGGTNNQVGYAGGVRVYFNKPEDSTRFRLSLLYGTVAYLKTSTTNALTNVTTDTYELKTGFYPAVGFKMSHFDIDVGYAFGYTIPAGASSQSSNILVSLGYRF